MKYPEKTPECPVAGREPELGVSSNPSPSVALNGRISAIDGLRGLAALLVLVYHLYGAPGDLGDPSILIAGHHVKPLEYLCFGGSGVELFFVLSGFCLAYPILSRSRERTNWLRYFCHRARRILPPYWLFFLFWAGVAFVIHRFKLEPWLSSGSWQSPSWQHFIQGLALVNVVYSGIFWTLVVEARWYVVFPVLMTFYFALPSRLPRGLVLFVCLLLISWFWAAKLTAIPFRGALQQMFSLLPEFLWAFGSGILIAEITVRRAAGENFHRLFQVVPWAIGLSLLFLVTQSPKPSHFTHVELWVIIFLYSWLVLGALHVPAINRCFSWKPLVHVGTFSYSLYLTHLLPIYLIIPLIKPLAWPWWLGVGFYLGIWSLVCLAFAYLFFLLAEKPFLRKPAIAGR